MNAAADAAEVRVQQADFDPGAEHEAIRRRAPNCGALVSFVGCVRDLAEDGEVTALELEHYPGVTERSVETVVRDALERWPLGAVTVVHRVGRLEPGERIVLVITASAHRRAAFESADFVMDHLKTRALFWKKEHRRDGARWVRSRDDDHAAAARWQVPDDPAEG
ncbi:MAG: molybdenum cofactor biosynthesis protein MoaE [Gammaproteobacteria bacterium]|nr:molybdenum cofactor biosynthesis protein MoaE [Gammaproteobacteria bacterium]